MSDFLVEDDFGDLPSEPQLRWLLLEKVVYSRLLHWLESAEVEKANELKNHYMDVVSTLAKNYQVDGVSIPNGNSLDWKFDTFRRFVTVAKTNILSSGIPLNQLGRVSLSENTKTAILGLVSEIEVQVENWQISEVRKHALRSYIENFRREINEPKTRISYALSEISKVATFAGMIAATTTTTLAQIPSAYATIQMLLGSEQLASHNPEARLIESEKQLLLPPPQKQITNQSILDPPK